VSFFTVADQLRELQFNFPNLFKSAAAAAPAALAASAATAATAATAAIEEIEKIKEINKTEIKTIPLDKTFLALNPQMGPDDLFASMFDDEDTGERAINALRV
jgi:hypothetical protein